jgi:hypothetical protein
MLIQGDRMPDRPHARVATSKSVRPKAWAEATTLDHRSDGVEETQASYRRPISVQHPLIETHLLKTSRAGVTDPLIGSIRVIEQVQVPPLDQA